MPNVFDIAREAGVSKSTVSRVINNQVGVNKDKRKRVLDAIEKLNYSPNAMARGLVLKKTNTIGVIVRELSNSFYSEFIKNIHYNADEKGYGALYCNRNSYVESNIDYLSSLNKKVDGYIFIGEGTVSQNELTTLVNSNYPSIVIQAKLDVPGVTYIQIDNYEATYKAVKYLVELGHKKIIYFCGPKDFELLERTRGYSQGLKDANLGFERIFYTDYFMSSAYKLTKNLVQYIKEEGITAALCSNNIVATGVIDGLLDSQIRVPEDFSVIGFDDIVNAEITNNNIPAITSVKQPQLEITLYALEKLLYMIEHGCDDYCKNFECQLMIRKSTAPCPKKSLG